MAKKAVVRKPEIVRLEEVIVAYGRQQGRIWSFLDSLRSDLEEGLEGDQAAESIRRFMLTDNLFQEPEGEALEVVEGDRNPSVGTTPPNVSEDTAK